MVGSLILLLWVVGGRAQQIAHAQAQNPVPWKTRQSAPATSQQSASVATQKSASAKALQSFSFVHLSDTHVGSPTGLDDLRRTISDINALPDIRFVIISGDITEFGSDAELRQAKQAFDSLQKPWYIIPGNHDDCWSESGTNSFRQVFGKETFDFTYGGYRFLGTNCGPNLRMGPGQVPHEHLVWLEESLRHLPDPGMPVIFVNHYPIDSALNNWYQVIDLLKQYNTQAILCGHGHANHLLNFEGIPGIMGRSNLRAKDSVGGYNIVTLKDGKLTYSERHPAYTGHHTASSFSQAPSAGNQTSSAGNHNASAAYHANSTDNQAASTGNQAASFTHPGVTADTAWASVSLQRIAFAKAPVRYPRPSYALNDRYTALKELWSVQDSADIGCGMALCKDLLITADAGGQVFALQQKTGHRVWQFMTGGKIFSTPAVSEDKLVVASTDGAVYCLQAATGAMLWKYKTARPIVASPLVREGMVYLGASDGHFRALRLSSGELSWEFGEVTGFVESKPLYYGGRIYFASWGNELYALNAGTGRLEWKWSNGATNRMFSAASCMPVAAAGRLFIVAPDRFMTALDAASGKQIWRKHWDSAWVRESMGLSSDSSLVYVKTMQGRLLGVSTNAASPTIAWTASLDLGYELDPAAIFESEGVVFVPSDKGVATGVDRMTGKIRWQHKIAHSLLNTVLPGPQGLVFVSSMDGKISCLYAPREL